MAWGSRSVGEVCRPLRVERELATIECLACDPWGDAEPLVGLSGWSFGLYMHDPVFGGR